MQLYKKYKYLVQWSPEDKAYIGTCAEFPSLSCVGDDPVLVLIEVMSLIDSIVYECERNGEQPPQPLCEVNGEK